MRVQVHDVDHGCCVTITSPSGHVMMFDCGYSLDRPWFPSVAYAGQTISLLGLLNLDEDHVQDFPGLWDRTVIKGLISNPTVDAAALRDLKNGSMGAGVQKAHDVLAHFGSGLLGEWQDYLGGVTWQAFYNRHGVFTDSNNLSLAVFVSWGGFTILLGGDMECAGWEKLLQNPRFVARLKEVRVYIASHHGRANGICPTLFDHMRPDVVIFSDGPKLHGTQETRDWYAGRVTGIIDNSKPWTASGPVKRQVMTTRRDGTLDIQVNAVGGYTVFYEKSEPTLEEIIALMFPAKRSAASILSGFP